MKDNPFVGTWRLISFEMIDAEGRVEHPYGERPVGYIMYCADGYMSVAFMRRDRPKLQGLRGAGSAEERAAAAESHFSYAGPYEIRPEKVVHHLDVCSSPNWVGLTQERVYTFEGDRLTLRAMPGPGSGMRREGRLVWERVPAGDPHSNPRT